MCELQNSDLKLHCISRKALVGAMIGATIDAIAEDGVPIGNRLHLLDLFYLRNPLANEE